MYMEQPNYIPLSSSITKIKTIVYTKMEIKMLRHSLGENQCEFQVIVYDETSEYLKYFCYALTGQEYLNWTTDEYLINWVQQKLRYETF